MYILLVLVHSTEEREDRYLVTQIHKDTMPRFEEAKRFEIGREAERARERETANYYTK